MHIIYGKRRVPIGIDELFIACPSCEAHNPSDIMISSTYIHVFWIPAFPIRKDASLICKKCGLKRYDFDFDSRALDEYKDLRSKFRHPFYTYIGVAFFLTIIALSLLVKVLTRTN
jgi:hypothetical protein